jgi:hypothetical protein
MALEASHVRRLVVGRLAEVKRVAGIRREKIAAAERDYATFLSTAATPAFTLVAQILASENYPFRVTTPGEGVRLISDRSPRTYVDVRLDTSGPEPLVVAEVSRERGHRVLVDDRPVGAGQAIGALTDQDVIAMLVATIAELVER